MGKKKPGQKKPIRVLREAFKNQKVCLSRTGGVGVVSLLEKIEGLWALTIRVETIKKIV